jgi:lipoprotein NlpI
LDSLSEELRGLSRSWQWPFGSKPVTDVQTAAQVDRLLLTAFIKGGRLPPDLKAETLRKRGVALDNLGLNELAKADFDEALALAPENPEILADAAVNAFALGQDEKAAEYANKAISLAPSNLAPKATLAYLAYYGNNYPEAKRNLYDRLRNRREINQGYATIWLYLSAKRNNEDALAAVKPYLAVDQSSWPHPVLKYLMGTGTWDQALKAAQENETDPSRLCELYFYAGESALIEGRTQQARELFNKSLETGVVEFNEYLTSKRSLQQLK